MIFLWVPETKQRTLEELDYICESATWKFLDSTALMLRTQSQFQPVNTCFTRLPRFCLGPSADIYFDRTSFCVHFTSFRDIHDMALLSKYYGVCGRIK